MKDQIRMSMRKEKKQNWQERASGVNLQRWLKKKKTQVKDEKGE